MTTPAEALVKWCPYGNYLRTHSGGPSAFGTAVANVEIDINNNTVTPVSKCFVTGCCMWRWTPGQMGIDGYCGLAGKE